MKKHAKARTVAMGDCGCAPADAPVGEDAAVYGDGRETPNGHAQGFGTNGFPNDALLMPGDEAYGLRADDEGGMPGLLRRHPDADRPGGGMLEAKPRQRSNAMPGGDGMGGANLGGGGGGASGGGSSGGGNGKTPATRKCGTMDVHRRLLSTNPAYAQRRAAIENQAMRALAGQAPSQRNGITRIPVVVHVVWNTPAQNVSQAQIDSQIAVLNRDFRRTNPDVSSTPAPFLPLAADARIEFELARVDPNGAPTDGVQRRKTTVVGFIDDDAVKSTARGGLDGWRSDRYLNIWVCPLADGLLGYAQFPGGPAADDGVVILHSAFGTNGSAAAPFNLGRTTTHEIGHWLNLNHIWGDDGNGCSGTDNVPDTPNQGGANTGAPTFPRISCNNGPHGDMFMNYMDYVDDRAMVMFSSGQVARMQACLDGPRASIGIAATAAIRPSSNPMVSWGPDRLDLFVLGTDRALYHKWWNGSAWGPSVSGYESLGGVCTSVPQAVSWGPDRLDVFVTGTDSALYHKWWNGSDWGPSVDGWESQGGVCMGEPRIVSWGADRLDVFVLGTNRALYHKWWNGSAWGPSITSFESLGGICEGQPEAVSWGPDRLDIFVIGTDRALYHKWWNGSAWGPSDSGYERLGGVCISNPRAVSWGPNRLDIFVTGTDGALYHKWWDGSAWGPSTDGFERLGGICVGEIDVVSWGPDRLDIFVKGTDGAMYHKWWNGSAWGPSQDGYERQGGVLTSQPRALAWGPNRLDVFVRGTDSALYHKWWDGSAWGPSPDGYESLGGVISALRQQAPVQAEAAAPPALAEGAAEGMSEGTAPPQTPQYIAPTHDVGPASLTMQ